MQRYRWTRQAGLLLVAELFLAMPAQAALAAEPGAVDQSGGAAVGPDAKPPALQLSEQQHAEIRRALAQVHTEVDPKFKDTASAKDFKPSVGGKLPTGLSGTALPSPVLTSIPELKQYYYVKVGGQILIVNPMNNTVIDIFSES